MVYSHRLLYVDVQSNQKMHDLYATKHISQMALPDAFLGSIESNFFII